MRSPTTLVAACTLFAVMVIGMLGCQSIQMAETWEASLGVVPTTPLKPADLHKELNIKVDLIAPNRFGRRGARRMTPKFITIHSTQNFDGDAHDHARALNKGALKGGIIGYLSWHFTVQQDVVIQHIPTSERGEHADFDGPGNRYSIGIEMCEHTGNDLPQTIERTAKLAASLMHHHEIAIENVVPHYHWPRQGLTPPNKDCPHFLLEKGKPRDAWSWFLTRVNRHYQRIVLHEQLKSHAAVEPVPSRENGQWAVVKRSGDYFRPDWLPAQPMEGVPRRTWCLFRETFLYWNRNFDIIPT